MQYNIENKTLICIGDVHGEFATLRFKLAQYIEKYPLTNNHIYSLWGLWFLWT